MTEHIQFRINVGYTIFNADTTSAVSADSSGPYMAAMLRHEINERITQSLSGGRAVSLGFLGGNYQIDSIRWQADWRIINKVQLSTPVYYERWSRVSSVPGASDEFTRIGAGFTISRPLTQHLNSSLAYQLIWKDSRIARQSYTVNILTLNFSYRF